MTKEYITKLNELLDELYELYRAEVDENRQLEYTTFDDKYNQLKGYLSALETFGKKNITKISIINMSKLQQI